VTMTVPGQDRSSFSIILPTYNEVDNIASIVRELLSLYPGARVLVSDDNSIDGTVETVRDISADHPSVRLISRNPYDRALPPASWTGS